MISVSSSEFEIMRLPADRSPAVIRRQKSIAIDHGCTSIYVSIDPIEGREMVALSKKHSYLSLQEPFEPTPLRGAAQFRCKALFTHIPERIT